MQKLPKARFNLKTPNAKTETLIFLVFRYNGCKVLYSTGLNVHPKDWDTKTQRPIERRQRKDIWLLNQKIEALSQKCREIYINFSYGDLTVREFKEKLSAIEENAKEKTTRRKAASKPKRIEFLDFLDVELAEMEATGTKKDTIRNFTVHANRLKLFASESGTFNYEDIDWDLRLKLIDWLTEKKTQLSYGNKTLKILRMFSERARKKQLHTNVKYQGRGWMISETKARGHKVYFNPQELQILVNLKLTGIQNKVRDLFLIGAAN